MKDEIKEILNDLQRVADRKCYPEDILCGSIAQEWVDCITNLQEELKSANESITWWQNRFNALQEENEKLKKEPLTNKISRIDSVVANIYKENEDYKSRNEKAIELINVWLDGLNNDDIIILLNNLGNILNGGENEKHNQNND